MSTSALAEIFSVTEETVRRDFEKLEKKGILLRSHGGAVQLEAQRREYPVRERAAQHAREKIRIARHAVRHVKAGNTIFLDPSTTVQHLAGFLPNEPLTVLTNSLQIPLLFEDKPFIRVVVLGGTLLPNSLSCAGPAAEQALDLYRLDAAFISCQGLEPDRGLSEATEEQARLKRRVIERAETTHLLADHSKINVSSSFFFSPLSSVDFLITDRPPSPPLKKVFADMGIIIEVARP